MLFIITYFFPVHRDCRTDWSWFATHTPGYEILLGGVIVEQEEEGIPFLLFLFVWSWCFLGFVWIYERICWQEEREREKNFKHIQFSPFSSISLFESLHKSKVQITALGLYILAKSQCFSGTPIVYFPVSLPIVMILIGWIISMNRRQWEIFFSCLRN